MTRNGLRAGALAGVLALTLGVGTAFANTPHPHADQGFYFDEYPAVQGLGGTGPQIIGKKAGYNHKNVARTLADAKRDAGLKVDIVFNGERSFTLLWAADNPRSTYRFGPWEREGARDAALQRRVARTDVECFPYQGIEKSLYPAPVS